jgi:hypothetical protein
MIAHNKYKKSPLEKFNISSRTQKAFKRHIVSQKQINLYYFRKERCVLFCLNDDKGAC